MEKVDSKLLQMKMDIQKLLKDEKKDNDEDNNGRTKQTNIIMKDQRESTVMLDKKLREMMERIEKLERSDDSFKHNLMGQLKEENQKIVSVIEKLIQKLQEEREEETAAAEPKKNLECCQIGHGIPNIKPRLFVLIRPYWTN